MGPDAIDRPGRYTRGKRCTSARYERGATQVMESQILRGTQKSPLYPHHGPQGNTHARRHVRWDSPWP